MTTIVVSDLHLGPDGVEPIYAGGAQLPALLDEQPGGTRVVVNGDAFDLLLDNDPLGVDRAVARIDACARSRDGAAVLAALARSTQRGGDVLIRPGNHDLELARPEVQQALLGCLVESGAARERVAFWQEDEPTILIETGRRVLVTHGEHQDPFNRWTRADQTYPPGSRLVKDTMNKIKRELRFIDLLKPDFHGAILTALAVKPGLLRGLLDRSTLDIAMAAIERHVAGASPFGGDAVPFEMQVGEAALEPEERNIVLDFLESGHAFAGGEGALLRRALAKLGRAAMWLYAGTHRASARKEGSAFFSDEPSPDEWREAGRLAKKYDADVVIAGHTHARRLRTEGALTYANTGTWIALLRLPSSDASVDDWVAYLDVLSADPRLAGAARKLVEVHGTACVVDEHGVRLVGLTSPLPDGW